jgi:hypothetical protein
LQRAKNKLGVKAVKLGMSEGWTWSCPPKMRNPAEDAQTKNLRTFEEVEHLRATTEVEIEI